LCSDIFEEFVVEQEVEIVGEYVFFVKEWRVDDFS
jgi:hypothetical protein